MPRVNSPSSDNSTSSPKSESPQSSPLMLGKAGPRPDSIVDDQRDQKILYLNFEKETGFHRDSNIDMWLNHKPAADEGPLMMWRWRVGHAIESTPGRLILTVAIIVNAVTIGVQADYDSDSDIWIWIELGFTIIYSVELAANLFAFQWIYLVTFGTGLTSSSSCLRS